MTAYRDDIPVDTSSIDYKNSGMRLTKFVKDAFGNDIFEKVKKGELIVWFNSRELKYDKNFRDNRVHVSTHVNVKSKEDEIIHEIPDMFA